VAQSNVKLTVDATGAISAIQRTNNLTKKLSKSTDELKRRVDKSNKSLKNTDKAAKQATVGVKGLTGALAPLLKALAVAASVRFVFIKTAEIETQRKSLEVLTGSLEKTNKIIQEIQDFGAVTPFTSSELLDQTKRLKAFGFETEELVDSIKRISDVAGATGADLSGIATAFGQIRAKGKLQQEENLQLLERGVDITTELKKITGKQGEEFESAMRKGQIGADLVTQALINLTDKGGTFAGGATAQADTLNGKLSTLQDTIDNLARTIGTELEEEIKGILDISIAAVKQISTLIESIGLVNKLGKKDMIKIETEARDFATEEISKEFGFFERRFSKEAREEFQKLMALKKKDLITDALKTKELTKQEKIEKDIKEITTNAIEKANEIKDTNEKNNVVLEEKVNKVTKVNGLLKDQKDIVTETTTEAEKLKEAYKKVGESIATNIRDSLVEAVKGTKTLGEMATSILNDIADAFLRIGITQALKGTGLGIFSGLGFANGGRPPVGKASVVGERGPELFVPSVAGTIVPNHNIGGGDNIVNISVDARGSQVEASDTDAKQLGLAIASAVQQQLVKEQRPGGLLSA
jgi:tape measure domain-containing protein